MIYSWYWFKWNWQNIISRVNDKILCHNLDQMAYKSVRGLISFDYGMTLFERGADEEFIRRAY